MDEVHTPTGWDTAGFVDVGGYRLAYREKGQGLPTVVLEMGIGVAVLVTRREEAWQNRQCELAALSSRSLHVIAERSGHLVHTEQPEMIVVGIRHALALVRQHEGT
jgi:hypothetical protein